MPITNGVSDATCVWKDKKKWARRFCFSSRHFFFAFILSWKKNATSARHFFRKKVETFTKGMMAAPESSLVSLVRISLGSNCRNRKSLCRIGLGFGTDRDRTTTSKKAKRPRRRPRLLVPPLVAPGVRWRWTQVDGRQGIHDIELNFDWSRSTWMEGIGIRSCPRFYR